MTMCHLRFTGAVLVMLYTALLHTLLNICLVSSFYFCLSCANGLLVLSLFPFLHFVWTLTDSCSVSSTKRRSSPSALKHLSVSTSYLPSGKKLTTETQQDQGLLNTSRTGVAASVGDLAGKRNKNTRDQPRML